MNQVLKPSVDDLNALSTEGIEVNRDGLVKIIGALTAFLADNLASHTVGGFKQSMSFSVDLVLQQRKAHQTVLQQMLLNCVHQMNMKECVLK